MNWKISTGIYFNRLKQGMIRYLLVLDVWFLFHIGKDWFMVSSCLLWYTPSHRKLLGLRFILAAETESFKWILLHFSFFYSEKYISCILICILDMDLRRYLHWIAWMSVVFRISYRKDCIDIEGIYIYASHVVAYRIFHLTKIALSIICYGVHIYFTAESS